MHELYHLRDVNDPDETITFWIESIEGESSEDRQYRLLSEALEAAGLEGPYEGSGID